MRIAVWHDLKSGGGKRALYNHIKGLVERGHEVVSFCPDTADTKFMPLSDFGEEHVFPLQQKWEPKNQWLKNLHPHVHKKTKAMLAHCKECAEVINRGNFDVLFANSSSFSYMGHIGRYVKLPKLIYLGEPFRYLYEAQPDFLWKAPNKSNPINYILQRCKHMLRMYWYSYMCREEYISAVTYDLILVNSFFSRESVKRAYNLDSKVCYLGIDTEKFNLKPTLKGNYIMGLGYVQPSKGIDTAVNALAAVDAAHRPTLVWVGNNRKHSNYIDKIKAYAASKNVDLVIKTMVSDEELMRLLSEARAFLYFSNLEPFGLAPLEANACGTAVISIAEGGPRETIKNNVNGFLVNDLSYEQIAGYIKLFAQDINFATEIGFRSREYILNNWSFDSGTDNIEHWLKSLKKTNPHSILNPQ